MYIHAVMYETTPPGVHPIMRRRKPDPHRVRPLPEFMHKRFHELCDEMKAYCENQRDTWLAAIAVDETEHSQGMYAYWYMASNFIPVVRKLGTDNGHHSSNS